MEACTVSELKVHSKRNAYVLSPEMMSRLQNEVSVSVFLEPGTTLIKIREGSFDYRAASGHSGEPLVMLWIYGGKVVNQKTGVPVMATWSTLNGYDDSLTLEVLEPATLCAFFFDTYLEDNEGEVQLSIVRI
jgi:phosphate transport system substrate-binding protein